MAKVALHHRHCLDALQDLPSDHVDAVVTDPPYGIRFMGHRWDYTIPPVAEWLECLRVLKPGGYLLSFASPRTQHRMASNIEEAGFELRDMIGWVYGTGFPKSLNLSKAMGKRGDKEAQQWEGWGTALKPALEPITVARKVFTGAIIDNVLEHGPGGLNINGCRVGESKRVPGSVSTRTQSTCYGTFAATEVLGEGGHDPNTGRWPANLIHDGGEEVVDLFGESARFFYCPKASKKDRGPDNNHPTVKPTDLMRYLCRLVTPPGGTILDPFMGSGSTGKAAILEGFSFIGIDKDEEAYLMALKRLQLEGVQDGESK